jgi:hypothetical protein
MYPYRWKGWDQTVCLAGGSLHWADSNPDRNSGSNLGSVSDVTLPGSPGIVVYQDHYGDHYRKKNGHPYNDTEEI